MTYRKCPICAGTAIRRIDVPHTFFRHMDFQPTETQPGYVLKCTSCQTAYMGDAAAVRESHTIHAGEDYARNKKTQYVVYTPDGVGSTTYAQLANLIAPRIKTTTPRFLDIGCFDGKLLLELDQKFPTAEFHGFDVSEHIAEIFPQRPNFTYWCRDLSSVGGKFDAVLIVNALMYVEDPAQLLRGVRSLLKDGGTLFVVVPNVERNPFALLYADQHTFFTPGILRELLRAFGFRAAIVDTASGFPRSLIAFAEPAIDAGSPPHEDSAVEAAADYLNAAKRKLLAAVAQRKAATRTGRIVVLGVNVNAAWVQGVLGADLDGFVDENPSRIGATFYGKKVVHPDQLAAGDLLVLPYAQTAKDIAAKFEARYPATLLCI